MLWWNIKGTYTYNIMYFSDASPIDQSDLSIILFTAFTEDWFYDAPIFQFSHGAVRRQRCSVITSIITKILLTWCVAMLVTAHSISHLLTDHVLTHLPNVACLCSLDLLSELVSFICSIYCRCEIRWENYDQVYVNRWCEDTCVICHSSNYSLNVM